LIAVSFRNIYIQLVTRLGGVLRQVHIRRDLRDNRKNEKILAFISLTEAKKF